MGGSGLDGVNGDGACGYPEDPAVLAVAVYAVVTDLYSFWRDLRAPAAFGRISAEPSASAVPAPLYSLPPVATSLGLTTQLETGRSPRLISVAVCGWTYARISKSLGLRATLSPTERHPRRSKRPAARRSRKQPRCPPTEGYPLSLVSLTGSAVAANAIITMGRIARGSSDAYMSITP